MDMIGRGSRPTRLGIAGFILVAGIAGCATVLGIDADRHITLDPVDGQTPATDEAGDDAGPFPGVPANWACLNNPIPKKPTGSVQLEFFFNSASGNASSGNGDVGTPVPGADVHACNLLDVGCQYPFSDQTTDDAGIAVETVPIGFSGYYEMHATNFTPTILSRTPQYSSEYQSQGVANLTLLSAGAGFAGVTQDPNLSIALVTASDCTTTQAAGIVFSVPKPGPGETVVYLQNNLPTQSATETDSVSGTAMIFNVPPTETLTVTAFFAATNQPIRTVSAIAREGWVTYVDIRPDQASHQPIPDD
jgi:hypothetical protein